MMRSSYSTPQVQASPQARGYPAQSVARAGQPLSAARPSPVSAYGGASPVSAYGGGSPVYQQYQGGGAPSPYANASSPYASSAGGVSAALQARGGTPLSGSSLPRGTPAVQRPSIVGQSPTAQPAISARSAAQPASLAPRVANASAPAPPGSSRAAKVIGTTNLDGSPVDARAAKSTPKALDLKTGAIRKEAAPQVRPEVDRLARLLRDHDEMKKHVVLAFEETNKKVAHAGKDELDLGRLSMFRQAIARALQVSPDQAFANMEMDFERFDFSGKGALSINSAYRMVKFHLLEYRKRLGAGASTSDVPVNTVQGAGYQIIKVLGQGSQGTAKLAYDRSGQEVCVKSFDKTQMNGQAASDLLLEFENLKLLQCEGIAGAMEMFQDNLCYYIVGDVYTGGDFTTFKQRALQQGVMMTDEWVKSTWKQTLDAIAFMHQQALIHCDLKEPNLMLRDCDFQNPTVVIIDLGVAESMASKDKDSPAGTPGYVPPEVLETFKWYPRGDLFSIGVTIMQVMTDKIPNGTLGPGSGGLFVENCSSIPEVFQATKNRVPPFHLMPPQYAGLTALLKKLLEKNVKRRPTALEALNDPWFTGGGVGAGEQTWAASEGRQLLRPKNKLATCGITKSFIQRIEADSGL